MSEENESSKQSYNSLLSDNSFAITLGAIFAGLSILVILIVGIISGVSFWVIFKRILFWGVVFFVGGYLFGWLLSKHVPEITQISLEGSNDIKDSSLGKNVDYIADTDEEDDEEKEYIEGFSQKDNIVVDSGKSDLSEMKKKTQGFSIPDDPKMAADAVRTMMNKDE